MITADIHEDRNYLFWLALSSAPGIETAVQYVLDGCLSELTIAFVL